MGKEYLDYITEIRTGKAPAKEGAMACSPIVQAFCDGKARGMCNQCMGRIANG